MKHTASVNICLLANAGVSFCTFTFINLVDFMLPGGWKKGNKEDKNGRNQGFWCWFISLKTQFEANCSLSLSF